MTTSLITPWTSSSATMPPLNRIETLVDEVLSSVLHRMTTRRQPSATYRVQLNSECTFQQVAAIIPYLHTLGVSDVYASPFFGAYPGSQHGYDVVDHAVLNPELGGEQELNLLSVALREHHMGLIADMVPNHMSASPQHNRWWLDVLENGPSSLHANIFDIDWHPLKPDLENKVLLPVLGAQFGEELESGKLQLAYAEGSFWLNYYDKRYPLTPESYALVLAPQLESLQERLGDEHADLMEFLSILTAMKNLPLYTETNEDRCVDRCREKEVIKRRLHELQSRSPEISAFIAERVLAVNGQPNDPHSYDALETLLAAQPYRLAFWRVAADEINYRRFFDINDLAAICMEHSDVFEQTHRLLFSLLETGVVTGLRIDHPDGLYAPKEYLCQLQETYFLSLCRQAWQQMIDTVDEALAPWETLASRFRELWRNATKIPGSPLAKPLFVVVEKILARNEPLPEDWPVHGTVGYECLNLLNGLFVDSANERAVSVLYTRFTQQSLDFRELCQECKRLVVRSSMASELQVLGYQLDRISEANRWTRDFTLSSLTQALREVMVFLPVYRTYVKPGLILERDVHFVERAVNLAKRYNPSMSGSIFDFLRDVLLLRGPEFKTDTATTTSQTGVQAAKERFVGKLQQLTGSMMAKAVEDTAFYRFNRLISLNEVGGDPGHFSVSPKEFHRFHLNRPVRLASTLNATSTHDTKRSEDVRVRIDVLSEIPREWRERVQRWARMNRRFKTEIDGAEAPSRNAEYLLYQTMVGIWPDTIPSSGMHKSFLDRLENYMLKVVREAKVHSSWINPHEPYETALLHFVERLFHSENAAKFLADMHAFASQVAEHGRWNSLSQLVLKLTSPGVPDFYQGCELWNLRLVDPDNRHVVDYDSARKSLAELIHQMAGIFPSQSPVNSADLWLNDFINHLDATLTECSQDTSDSKSTAVYRLLARLLQDRTNGGIKQFVTMLGLRFRRSCPELFLNGDYIPLETTGIYADRVVAFSRSYHEQSLIVIAPRLTVKVTGFGGQPPVGEVWQDTALILPPAQVMNPPNQWQFRDLFSLHSLTGEMQQNANPGTLRISQVLSHFPVALLIH
jgi:(1->4)-alpha-D-glucan 1-alpha-D-glucosylmutase